MILSLLSLLLAAAAPASPEAEIATASRAFDEAQLHGDRAVLERMLARDMLFVRGSGLATGRAAFLDSFASGRLALEPFVITDRRVIPLGPDAGIVAAEGTIRGREDGKPFVERFRYADIFQRRDGRWQVVYVQVTPLPPPAR